MERDLYIRALLRYVWRNNVAHSLKHCCYGNATVGPIASLRLSVTVNNVINTKKKMPLKSISDIFLPDFNQIWILSTDFDEVPNNRHHRNPFIWNHTDTMRQAVVRPRRS